MGSSRAHLSWRRANGTRLQGEGPGRPRTPPTPTPAATASGGRRTHSRQPGLCLHRPPRRGSRWPPENEHVVAPARTAAAVRSHTPLGPAETGRLRGLTEPHVGARGHGDSVPVCDTARRPRQLVAGSRQRGPGGRVPAARCGATAAAEPGRRPPPISVSRRVRSRPAAPVALSPCRLSPCPESLSLPARSPPPPPRSTRTARPTARRPEGSRKIALPGETP